MYNKLSGMTGTADTEATEFKQIYKLEVSVIPTNREMIRKDQADVIFKSELGKLKAITTEIKALQEKGQPVLVGTVSVDKSEKLSAYLKQAGVKHSVLNAKQHDREAEIVAQAGRKGALTISTNMAGRGTDILLGGNPESMAKAEMGPLKHDATPEEVAGHDKKYAEILKQWQERCMREREEVRSLGGLFILGTERHESRRIDNQLRGRAGRQGDPGESKFYLSLDDDLMRIFGGVNIGRFMEEELPIEHRWITKAIENAQRKVEGHNYDIRKHLLEYDDVMNQQRKVVYAWRKEVLSNENLRGMIFSMVDEITGVIAEDFFPNGKLKRGDGHSGLDSKELNDAVQVTLQIQSKIEEKDIVPFNNLGLKKILLEQAELAYANKEKTLGVEVVRQIEKMILLTTIDQLWKDHLLAMDHLREGIGLQGYGQKDPLIEYKKQGFGFFEMMMNQITGDVVRKLFAVQLAPTDTYEEEMPEAPAMEFNISADGNLIPQNPGAASPVPAQTLQASPPRANQSQSGGLMPPVHQMNLGRGPVQGGSGSGLAPLPAGTDIEKIGRNDTCPCGSGKKFKKCHGA
jgi:preprotein translocase subunit SecA